MAPGVLITLLKIKQVEELMNHLANLEPRAFCKSLETSGLVGAQRLQGHGWAGATDQWSGQQEAGPGLAAVTPTLHCSPRSARLSPFHS